MSVTPAAIQMFVQLAARSSPHTLQNQTEVIDIDRSFDADTGSSQFDNDHAIRVQLCGRYLAAHYFGDTDRH
jgi:hypothetical protein